MSFQKTHVEGKPLTLELAQSWASMQPMPGERDLKPVRRDYLLNALRDGIFAGPNWACAIDRKTKAVYRADGQHSSNVLIGLPDDLPFPSGLLVTIDTYEMDSIEEDAAALFNLFNHPKSARTNEDAIGVYTARVVELKSISRKLQQKIADGIAEYESGLSSKSQLVLGPRQRGIYFAQPDHKYAKFACFAAGFKDSRNKAFLSRSSIVAEMLHGWLQDADRAGAFWLFVLEESHPDRDHESRQLAETFKQWATKEKKYKPSQYRAQAAKAWRRYLRETRGAEPADTPEEVDHNQGNLNSTGDQPSL